MIDKDELLKRVTPEIVIEIMDENGAPLNHTSRDGSTGQQLCGLKLFVMEVLNLNSVISLNQKTFSVILHVEQ